MSLNIYQVVQNIDYLDGHYLVSAIVLCKGEEEARRKVVKWCKEYNAASDPHEEPLPLHCDQNRFVVRKIGTATIPNASALKSVGINRVGRSSHGVICAQVGVDA
jgi:hypothetical protein